MIRKATVQQEAVGDEKDEKPKMGRPKKAKPMSAAERKRKSHLNPEVKKREYEKEKEKNQRIEGEQWRKIETNVAKAEGKSKKKYDKTKKVWSTTESQGKEEAGSWEVWRIHRTHKETPRINESQGKFQENTTEVATEEKKKTAWRTTVFARAWRAHRLHEICDK